MSAQDVFISYAHLDNESLLEEHDGWISIFHRVLEKRLAQLLGRTAVVWWDQKRLTGNCYFDETIANACDNSAVMISIVTPRYLKSDYCKLEVEHFSRRQGGLRVGDRSRLVTAIKTPVARSALFTAMERNLGYEFFLDHDEDGRFREFDIYDPKLRPQFMTALEDLAQDVSGLLTSIANTTPSTKVQSVQAVQSGQSTRSTAPSSRPSAVAVKQPVTQIAQRVLVATTAGDVKAVRDGLVRELTAQSTLVAPEQAFSENLAGFEQDLAQAVEGVCLSVHLFGTNYGTIPEDADAAYPVLQFDKLRQLAAERTPNAPLARIVWLAPGAKPTSEKQVQFLERVRSDPALGPLDELLSGTEEELKERVLAKLRTLAQQAEERALRAQREASLSSHPPRTTERGGLRPTLGPVPKIYVISSDVEPADNVAQVERTLGQQGMDVISSLELAEEDSEPAREARHQQWLEECDGCLIYHGITKVSWVRAQVDDVRKALGHRSNGAMLGHAVYVAPPIEALKRRYQVHFPKLEGSSEVNRDLVPFVEQIIGSEIPEAALAHEAVGE